MKELYLDAEMDVVKFSIEDVINTSTDSVATVDPTRETSVNGGMGGPNEGEWGDEWL